MRCPYRVARPVWTIVLPGIAGGLAFFAALWCAVTAGLSLGGWFQLARNYRDAAPGGEAVRCRYAQVGRTGYRGAVRVTLADDALHLSVLRPFRLGHPPLRIPWAAVVALPAGRFPGLFGVPFRVRPPGVRLTFEPRADAAVRAHVAPSEPPAS